MSDTLPTGFADGWVAHQGMQLVGNPVVYAALYPSLVDIGRENGYAVALHGSLRKDMDVIAIPWTENAASADDLVAAVVAGTGAEIQVTDSLHPHGRRVWTLVLANGSYLDFGVMPRGPA